MSCPSSGLAISQSIGNYSRFWRATETQQTRCSVQRIHRQDLLPTCKAFPKESTAYLWFTQSHEVCINNNAAGGPWLFVTQLNGVQGRLIDHLRNTQSVGLEDLQALVLDEADRLLEMGFAEEVSTCLGTKHQHAWDVQQACAQEVVSVLSM